MTYQTSLLYAEGVRNSFDLAFAGNGDLFATENSADRDNPEELNWIREGHHFGFPWRMGNLDNPQQFPAYDPSADLLLPSSFNAVRNGFYRNDPDYLSEPRRAEVSVTSTTVLIMNNMLLLIAKKKAPL